MSKVPHIAKTTLTTTLLLGLGLVALAAPASAAPCTPEQEQDQFQLFTSEPFAVPVPTNGVYWQNGNPQAAGQQHYVELWATNDDTTGSCTVWVRHYVKSSNTTPCPAEGRDGVPLAGVDNVFVPDHLEARQDGIYLVGESQDHDVHGYNEDVAGRCATSATTSSSENPDERRVFPVVLP